MDMTSLPLSTREMLLTYPFGVNAKNYSWDCPVQSQPNATEHTKHIVQELKRAILLTNQWCAIRSFKMLHQLTPACVYVRRATHKVTEQDLSTTAFAINRCCALARSPSPHVWGDSGLRIGLCRRQWTVFVVSWPRRRKRWMGSLQNLSFPNGLVVQIASLGVEPLHATPLPPSDCCSFCFGLTRYGVALGTVCNDRAYDDPGWCCECDCVNVID